MTDIERADQPKEYITPDLAEQTMGYSVNGVNGQAIPGTLSGIATPVAKGFPDYKIRLATEADIPAIVEFDLQTFGGVYDAFEGEPEELRRDLQSKFLGRLEKVGSQWMPILELDGKIVGLMNSCPTDKTPEDFVSWEETTNNGTLEGTYSPNGKNVYVVSLAATPEGSKGKNMLLAHQIGRLLRGGYETAFFESRLPGLRQWVEETKVTEGQEEADELPAETKLEYAEEYFNTFVEYKGRLVRLDKLIRLYDSIGCHCLRVVPDAYQDPESMNFGVVCTYNGDKLFDGSDLPVRIPENRVTRWVFGAAIQSAARSPKITSKIFG